jgi:integrase
MAVRLRKVEEVKRKDGIAYRVNLALPDAINKSQYKTFDLEEDAAKALALVNSEILKYNANKESALAVNRTRLDVAWPLYLSQRVNHLEPNTQKAYRTAYSKIKGKIEFVDQISKKWIDEELSSSNLRKNSAFKYYICWQTFLKWCDQKSFKTSPDYMDWDIDVFVGVKKKEKKWFTHEQFNSVIAELNKKTPYTAFIFKLCGFFGLRVEEALNMKRNQLDLNTGIMTIYGKGIGEDGKRTRYVTIGVDLAKKIIETSNELYVRHSKIITDESNVFIEERKGSEITYTTIVKRWISAVTKCGLDSHAYSTHACRRYSYLYLRDLGLDYEVIKQIVGHNSDAYRLYIGNITNQLQPLASKIKL